MKRFSALLAAFLVLIPLPAAAQAAVLTVDAPALALSCPSSILMEKETGTIL